MKTPSFNFMRRLREIGMFFQGRDEVHQTLRRLVRRLKKAGIPYVILGGMAVNAHGGVYILVTGRFPGSGQPGPVAFPDPDNVQQTIGNIQFVDLVTLVQLKLAARRHRDFGDVVELIRFNNLDEAFAAKLHRSVRSDYIEGLEEKRREDEYEEREG